MPAFQLRECPECRSDAAVSTTEGDVGDRLHYVCTLCDHEWDAVVPEPLDPMEDVATPFADNH